MTAFPGAFLDLAEVFRLRGPLDHRGLHAIAGLDRPELKSESFVPVTHSDLAEVETSNPADMFAALSKRDVLVHHPYDSFATSVQRFVEQAAADPQVLAIKQTLYRTSGDSPLIDALVDAAEAGKQVLVLVELKARFDEEANIRWARKLEQAGCHVVYGLIGLKTHSKVCLVVRDEPDGIRRYSHIGTGNYNPKTARQYEDLGLLTANPQIGGDLTNLFNNLSGYARGVDYQRVMVAPTAVRTGLVERIDAEIEHHQAAGRRGCGSRSTRWSTSRPSTPSTWPARPACRSTSGPRHLRAPAGRRGLSETIRVRSILGRFLEHSRIFWFENGGEPAGLDRLRRPHAPQPRPAGGGARPGGESRHVDELGSLLDLSFDGGTASWHLQPDGSWVRHHRSDDGAPLLDLQEHLIAAARRRRDGRAVSGGRPG